VSEFSQYFVAYRTRGVLHISVAFIALTLFACPSAALAAEDCEKLARNFELRTYKLLKRGGELCDTYKGQEEMTMAIAWDVASTVKVAVSLLTSFELAPERCRQVMKKRIDREESELSRLFEVVETQCAWLTEKAN
jgi:hypothetical protein